MKLLQLYSAILIGILTLTPSSNSWANPECANYDAGMRWVTSLDGSYTTEPHITVVGNLAYVSLGSVYVVDLADPENPEIVDQLSYQRLRGRLDANETLLVVGGGHSIPNIEIHSLADPRQPEFLLNYEMPNDVMDVCLVGNILYVSCKEIGLVTMSLVDPSNPVILGTIGDGGSSRVTHQNGYLYTLDYATNQNSKVIIYDLSTPTAPVETSRHMTGGRELNVQGDRLYIAKGVNGFEVGDISGYHASNPIWLGSFDEGIYIRSITGNGHYAFTTDGLQCFDISGPTPWERVDTHSAGFGSNEVTLFGNYALIPFRDGLQIFDVSQPGYEVKVLGIHSSEGTPQYQETVIFGNIAFVGNRIFNVGAEIEVVDISDPTNPILKSVIPTLGMEIISMVIRENHLYVSLLSGIQVYDISDPVHAESVGFLPTSGSSYMLEIIKNHLFIADYTGGLQIASLEDDPATPVIVGNYMAETKWIWAADPLLYVRSGSEVIVLDIGEPTNPYYMGSFDYNILLGFVLMQDSLAYVGKPDGIDVVDLTSPTAPVIVNSIPTSQPMGPMAATQDRLYASSQSGSLVVLNIDTPTDPQTVGTHTYGGSYIYNTLVHQGTVFVTSAYQFTMLPMDCSQISAVPSDGSIPSSRLELSVWPNPFNPMVQISFSLQKAGPVELQIFDLAGRHVRTLSSAEYHNSGQIKVEWNGTDNYNRSMASGIYFIRLQAGQQVATRKLMLAR